jgi:hypothetical protein
LDQSSQVIGRYPSYLHRLTQHPPTHFFHHPFVVAAAVSASAVSPVELSVSVTVSVSESSLDEDFVAKFLQFFSFCFETAGVPLLALLLFERSAEHLLQLPFHSMDDFVAVVISIDDDGHQFLNECS